MEGCGGKEQMRPVSGKGKGARSRQEKCRPDGVAQKVHLWLEEGIHMVMIAVIGQIAPVATSNCIRLKHTVPHTVPDCMQGELRAFAPFT
jgi:hypothetical protein